MKLENLRPSAALAVFLITAIASASVAVAPGQALAAKKKEDKKADRKPREMQARTDFAAGRFAEALDIYAGLYAETLHPTYLRNIGRCYMNMSQPEKAATSFREYLRKAKEITAEERREVEGFIAEMDKQQKQEEVTAETTKRQEPPPPPPAPPPPVRNDLVVKPAPAPAPEPEPFYTRGWFWGVVGGVVVAGVLGTLWATGTFSRKNKCVSGYTCP
jgi:hypothetical protein